MTAIVWTTLITAGAEGLIACACEDDDADVWVFTTGVEGVYQFCECFWSKGVAYFGAVDCDLSHAFGFFKDDV